MERDQYSQDYPDYDTGDPGYSEDSGVNTARRKHGNRGKLSKAGNTRACAKWRSRNKGRRRAYMRQYMAARRAGAEAAAG